MARAFDKAYHAVRDGIIAGRFPPSRRITEQEARQEGLDVDSASVYVHFEIVTRLTSSECFVPALVFNGKVMLAGSPLEIHTARKMQSSSRNLDTKHCRGSLL